MVGRGESGSEDDSIESAVYSKKNPTKKDRERNPRFHRRALDNVRSKPSKSFERTSKCEQHRRPCCQSACIPHANTGAGDSVGRVKKSLPDDYEPDSYLGSPFPLGPQFDTIMSHVGISAEDSDEIFDIGSQYTTRLVIGKGAFGYVIAAECTATGNKVAIKKVKSAMSDRVGALRLLREVRFLRQLRGHPNVITLVDVLLSDGDRQLDVYIVTELMEADLEQIIRSAQPLSLEHVRYLSQQLLCGLGHLHGHGIAHRDVKPSNLLVDSHCRLKLCDLGLARRLCRPAPVPPGEDALFTDYVVTRWYRAPELLLGSRAYSLAVDTWAAGCVVAEMLARRPVFRADDPAAMLHRIAAALGPPSSADVAAISAQPSLPPVARAFLAALASRPAAPGDAGLEDALGAGAEAEAVGAVRGLLRWDARARFTVDAALAHPFLAPLAPHPHPLLAAGGPAESEEDSEGEDDEAARVCGARALAARVVREAARCRT